MPSRRSLCVFALLLGHSGVSQQALATDNARPSDTFAVGAAMEKVEYFHAQDSVSGETQDGGQDQMFDPVVFLDPATSQSDYISIYAKHGESGLPEEHWSDVLVMPNWDLWTTCFCACPSTPPFRTRAATGTVRGGMSRSTTARSLIPQARQSSTSNAGASISLEAINQTASLSVVVWSLCTSTV